LPRPFWPRSPNAQQLTRGPVDDLVFPADPTG
jgi:hypothetical protein